MRYLIVIFTMLHSISAFAQTVETPAPSFIDVQPTFKIKSQMIDMTVLLSQAKSAYKSERYTESFNSFQTLLVHDRNNVEAAIGLGNSALSLGLYNEAYTIFSTLKAKHEQSDIDAGYALAKVESGKSQNVIRDLKAAMKSSGQDYRLWNALGRYYDQVELWGDSFDAYFTALSMGQGRAITLNNLGMSQMMQGNYKAAHESFVNAAALKPSAELYDNNGRLALALQNDYPNAIKGITGKRAAFIFNDAGYLAMTRGDKYRARLLFTKAIEISPVYHAKAHANLDVLNAL